MHPACLAALRCPHCAGPLHLDDRSLACGHGHRFDRARQGYVNLVAGAGTPHHGDDAAMVERRERVLADGLLEPVLAGLAEGADAALRQAPPDREAVVVDVGAGPAVHLARLVSGDAQRCGIAVDVSKHAARRAARAHPRITAIVADTWSGLPVADGAADLVVVVFAPRNAAELARVLAPHGQLLVAVPGDDHLAELRARLGLLEVEPGKDERISAQLAPQLELLDLRTVSWERPLTRAQAVDLVGMGPSAHHLDLDALAAELADDDQPLTMRGSVRLLAFAHPSGAAGES